ncbi:MAG TPA: glycosyltransferase family A protein [Xanthobacteraceae bacterium]|jgi:glycosyltransferase involved in cell wall biosynthesis
MERNQAADIRMAGHSILERNLKHTLVSIIVVNRNYAAYVGDTIQSIRAQDYPWFECFIIDNASTDDSLAVIERHVADDPRFTVQTLPENLGQLRGALQVFDRLRGEFVVSVDADDFLFPNFLSSHMQVHLALAVPVGFTSSNFVEIDANRNLLTAGRGDFGTNSEPDQRGLKPAAEALRLSAISDADYARLSDATFIVPNWKTQWVWAPGTSNFFRKSALNVALPDTSRIFGHAGWENYFCTIVHILSGSALISQHLSAYRYHGKNAFSMAPRLNAVRTYRNFAARRSATQRLHALCTLLSRAGEFNWILSGNRFWPTLDLLAGIESTTPRKYFSSGEVQEIFAEYMKALVDAFGERVVFENLRKRMGRVSTWRLARETHGGRLPLSARWMLTKVEIQRAREKRRRRD